MKYFFIFLSLIIYNQIFLNIAKAEDITISSNHSSQIVLSNNDTLTVESGVTVDTSAAEPVELEGHTFSTSSTTITNNGTIIGTTKGIEADQSTDFSIDNSGTVSVTDNANSPGSALSLLQSRGTVSIVNSGTFESERADTIKLHPSFGTVTINNSGSITSSKDRTINFGQHANAGTIINSGTISGRANTLYIYSSGTDYSAGTITNSGTISATGGDGFEINNVNDVTITNTGTISATGDAIFNIGDNGSNGNIIVNKGTISSGSSNHDLEVTTNVGLESLTNDQGGNDALKLEGYLPVNYVFLANSTNDYGKLAVDLQNGATTFSISADSALSAGTYTSVITGVSSSRFTAGSTGTVTVTNGKFNWTLTETSSGSTNWNLVVTNFDNDAPTLSSSSPSDNATEVATNANIVLTFSEAVDAESGNITIKKTSDDSTIETIDVTGAKVSGSGSTAITINPSTDLTADIDYYILIDATAFDDTNGNSYAGISSTTALNFSTKPGEVFNETVKTLTKNQTVAAINSLNQSLNRISGRMNYIRSTNNNSSNQNIRLAMNFDNQLLAQQINSLSAKLIKKEKKTEKWGVWSEGSISFGRIGQQDGNLGQDIHSDGITFGIDKKINEDKTIGFAINKSWQETEVGSNEANMDASTISIMNYTSFKIEDKRFFEMVAGIGEMDIDLSRDVTGGKNKGDRKGNQLFGSFTYLLEPDVEVVGRNLNYYSRLDLGFTQLKAYTETGDGTAVSYNKQNVKSASLSAGLNLSKVIENEKGIFEPSFKFELGKDKTINSLSEAYYINNSSEIYSNALGDQNSGHLLLNLGIGAKLNNNLTINVSYEHYRSTDDSFNNNFSIYVRKPL
ncbi:autotransporter domain-containing protein [Candidatus Pelagibacter sp.]|nr:autotransporter domain-containing protein [Candidatus Pelagibacter sp.]